MKRLLLLFGPAISFAGAVGLLLTGSAIADVFGLAFTMAIDDPFEPMAAALDNLRLVAISGGAITIGLAVSCMATVKHDSQRYLSTLGRVLLGVAGVLVLTGAFAVAWAVLGMRSAFVVIATSELAPTVESVKELLRAVPPKLTLGCMVLTLGVLILLVTGQVGFRSQPHGELGRRPILGTIAAVASAVLAVISCLLLMGVWMHSNALESILANSASVSLKATDLATHLSGITSGTLIAFAAFGFQGIMQTLAGLLAPSPNDGSDEDV